MDLEDQLERALNKAFPKPRPRKTAKKVMRYRMATDVGGSPVAVEVDSPKHKEFYTRQTLFVTWDDYSQLLERQIRYTRLLERMMKIHTP